MPNCFSMLILICNYKLNVIATDSRLFYTQQAVRLGVLSEEKRADLMVPEATTA